MEHVASGVIKGYELRERIGAGGFGAVYRAYQSTVGREVAIKIILPRFANHPDFIRRFENEAQLVARLEHPYIIPLYDYWRDPDGAYLVMRWLRGGSLREALNEGAFTLETAAHFLDQIGSALALAHRSNVIHRDLKPGNILLDEDGNHYLADFGIAKDTGSLTNGSTQADAIVGSPDYLAPEQARSEPVTPATDIYSLGVVLYEVLTGKHPFPDANPIDRMYKHLNDPLPPIENLPSDTLDAVNLVIQKATAKNPTHRYPDALALTAAFRDAAGLNRPTTSSNLVELLTPREQDILRRIIDGRSNKEIAQELFVTIATVKWYIKQIYGKLHVRSRVQAIVRARELNLIVSSGTVHPGGEGMDSVLLPEPINPYKGLRAFQSADYRDFFGREALTQKLLNHLVATPTNGRSGRTGLSSTLTNGQSESDNPRFLAVVGPSGSGKSSLVRAGLIPALWRGELPGSEKWFIVEMLPGSHPLDELEVALTRIAAAQSNTLHDHLQRDDRGLLRAAQLILPNDTSELLLVIDQFEEVFTLVETEAARIHFLDNLVTAATDPRSRVRVVITLRADFYDRPLHYPEFGELVRSGMEAVLPLSAESLERAIARPVEQQGMTFEEGLVTKIVGEVNYQPGALPLLQYALTELFERRDGHRLTHEAYQAIGGTIGALAKRADEIYEGLNERGKEVARQMFLRLVTLGEGVEDTRRRVARSELLAVCGDEEVMDDLIDTYATYRLLSLDNDPGTRTPTVEVAHEAILREWKRLRGWLNDSRADIRLQRQLAAMADEWRAAKQDASYLARGSRLEQFEKWAKDTGLALTPAERDYLTASFAERERQHAAEQERQAREARLEHRSRNFLRGLVAVLLLATLGAFGLTGVAVNQSNIAQQNAARADRNAAVAQNVALIAGSQAALANNNTDQAIALAMQAVTLDPTSTRAQVALSEAAYAPGTVRQFTGHTDNVDSVTVSPDGSKMLTASADKTLILWDIQTGAILRRFEGHSALVNDVAFSPDGHTAVSGADDKLAILWDLQTGQIIRRFEGYNQAIYTVAFSPDGQSVVAGGDGVNAPLMQWDVQTGQIIRQFNGHSDTIRDIAFSPDGRTILSGSNDHTIILWDAGTGKIIRQFSTPDDPFAFISVAFTPDGLSAASSQESNNPEHGGVIFWDLSTGQVLRRIDLGQADGPIAISPDGRWLLDGGSTGTIKLVDIQTGDTMGVFPGHGYINSIAFTPDSRYAVFAALNVPPRLLDLDAGQVIRQLADARGTGWKVVGSPDGHLAIVANANGTATLWNVTTGEEVRHYTDSQPVTTVAFSPDGKTALIGTGDVNGSPNSEPGHLVLWDVQTGQVIRRFAGHPYIVFDVEFSPDGRTAISGGGGKTLTLWDVQTGQVIRSFQGDELNTNEGGSGGGIWSVAFSPDGSTVLSAFPNGKLIQWDVTTGQKIRNFTGLTQGAEKVVFSRDGSKALTGGWDSTANLWDVAIGSIIYHFTNHTGAVFQTRFTPDEHFALGGSADGTSTLWDLQTGQAIRSYRNAGIYAQVFSPDGRSAFVDFPDGSIAQWRIDYSLDQLLTWTKANRYIPDLTCDQRALYQLVPLCDPQTPNAP